MKNGFAKVAALAAIGTLALSACSSNTASTSSSSSAAGGSSAAASSVKLECPAGTLTGAGSTAQGTAMDETIAAYAAKCNNKAKITYAGTGSGDGIAKFTAKQVDWAGSDSALKVDSEVGKAKDACSADALHLPMVAGPIAVVFNVDGVDKLTLKTETVAKIMKGQIKTWDDAEIKAQNPNAKLPSADITVYFRSDSSGTTDNFTNFLNKAAGSVWTDKHDKAWKGVGQGKEKSTGIQQAMQQNKNSISYVEWSFAKDGNIKVAQIDNGAGPVELTAQSAGKAVEAAKITGTGNDLRMELEYKDTKAGVYPIVLVTYEIVCSAGTPSKADNAGLLKDFLTFYASSENQSDLQKLGYAPLPTSISDKVQASIKTIK